MRAVKPRGADRGARAHPHRRGVAWGFDPPIAADPCRTQAALSVTPMLAVVLDRVEQQAELAPR